MKSKKKANIFLIFVIIIFSGLYIYYISINQGSIKIDNTNEESKNINLERGVTKFSDVEYKTTSDNNIDYITRGKQAFFSEKNPDLIQINNPHSFTKLKDGSILNVRSNKAEYFKKSKNIRYYENVIITNKKSIIKANVANFYRDKNIIELKQVIYKDEKNLIKSDLAILDVLTNNLEMHMKNKKQRVYGERRN